MNENNANFTPSAPNFKTLVRMSFQGLTNFPYIEEDFDALTNYELLSKVVEYLNEVISNNNEQNTTITNLYNAYVSLQDYVNEYFDNLDLQDEVNTKIDLMVADGTLLNLIKNYIDPIYQAYEDEINATVDNQNTEISSFKTSVTSQIGSINNKVNQATSGSPLAASSTDDMTDTDRIYVNTTDGNWYYYDGTSWTIGGVYQSTELAENEVTFNNLDLFLQSMIKPSDNILNTVDKFQNLYLNNLNGNTFEVNDYTCTDFIPVKQETIYFKMFSAIRICEYSADKTFLNITHDSTGNAYFTPNASTKFIRVAILTSQLSTLYLTYLNNILSINSLIPYYLKGDRITLNSIDDISIKDLDITKLKEFELISNNLFNKNAPYLNNSYLNTNTGITFTIDNYFVSDYQKMKSSQAYISTADRICFYDEDLNYITYSSKENNINSFTSPANCAYYRLSDQTSKLNTTILNEGSTLLNYDSYTYNLKGLNLSGDNGNTFIRTNIANTLYNANSTLKIVCVGNSITAGVGGSGYNENGSYIGSTGYRRNETGYCWANLLKDSLEDKYNCTVTNNGISGITSSYIVAHLSDLIPADSDIAILMIGTNDRISQERFEGLYSNLQTIYEYCISNNIKLIPMAPIPASLTDEEREDGTFNVRYAHMDDIANIVSAFANANNLEFIDNFENFYMFCYTRNEDVNTLLRDGLHPNNDGYYLMFRYITHKLGVDAKIKTATW